MILFCFCTVFSKPFKKRVEAKIFKDGNDLFTIKALIFQGGNDQSLEDINVKTVTDVTSDILVSPSAFVVEQIGDNYHEEPILGFSIVNEMGAYFIPKDIAVESEVFKDTSSDGTARFAPFP